jgi:circadian clock protein KaiB
MQREASPRLRLFVAGRTEGSLQAQKSMVALQAAVGAHRRIEIIDVLEHPDLAEAAGILATPTLSYDHPTRPRRIIGDMSDTQRVLAFLGLDAEGDRR